MNFLSGEWALDLRGLPAWVFLAATLFLALFGTGVGFLTLTQEHSKLGFLH